MIVCNNILLLPDYYKGHIVFFQKQMFFVDKDYFWITIYLN